MNAGAKTVTEHLAPATPHRVYPGGYHTDPKQPLPFAALASQKKA